MRRGEFQVRSGAQWTAKGAPVCREPSLRHAITEMVRQHGTCGYGLPLPYPDGKQSRYGLLASLDVKKYYVITVIDRVITTHLEYPFNIEYL